MDPFLTRIGPIDLAPLTGGHAISVLAIGYG
jgi:hypothetical protein